ncbi:MAG TPA: cadherin domain-containing protein, partial [Bradyrhizobium sp.]|nr:cadherin domain-containing protein [Bradyrhizobium sp.]
MAAYNASVDEINKLIEETWVKPNGDTVDRKFQYSGDDPSPSDATTTFSRNGSPTAQEQDFPAGRLLKYYDTQNYHPYKELDVSENNAGKVTGAQIVLDPTIIAASGSVGQVLGSTIGQALAHGKDPFLAIAGTTVAGLIGQKLLQTFTVSLASDFSREIVGDFATVTGFDVAHAGAGAIASFLTAELGRALHIEGFDGQLFNTVSNGFITSVLDQVSGKILSGLSFEAAIAAIDFGAAAIGAANGINNVLGSYLGHELVPAKTHEGAVGGQLLGAIGAALEISGALSVALGSVLNFIIPGIGSLVGTILGTLIGDAIASHPHPAAVDLIDQAGDHYGYTHSSVAEGGTYDAPDRMAAATVSIINGYLNAVKGAALDHSKQTMVGYVTDPDFRYINGWVPSHTYLSFIRPDDAVHAAALDVLQHIEVIGGDLLLKRAHANSPSSIPDPGPEWNGLTSPSSQSGAEKLATMGGDLSVAQDYENYLNNREAINALMAANPNSAFTAGWIATFARVNDLGLNQVGSSDFLGGLVGWLDSVAKAGLGAEAANAIVKRGSDNSVIVEIKVDNGVEVPGALSVFADHLTVTSDASGQTLQFTVDSGLNASGTLLLGPGASGTGGHDIMVGGAADDTFHGGVGWDFIDGGAGSDHLYGQDGNDILRGGRGNDFLFGGLGNDTYVFTRGDGADTVLDDYTVTTDTSHWKDEMRDEDGDGTNEFHHDWIPETTTDHRDAGTDTLVFGPGIARSDIVVRASPDGHDLIVGVRDPAHPGVAFEQLTDKITLQHWFDDAKDRIENFVFADGAPLNLAAGESALAQYKVPFGMTLSRSSVAENSAVGTVVATAAAFDLDANAILTYSLFDYGYGRFAIDPSTGVITVAAALNFEGTPAWPLIVRVTDQVGHVFEKPVNINVTDVNDKPTDIILSGGSAPEDSPGGTIIATARGIDPDAGTAWHYSLTDNAGGRFLIYQTGQIAIVDRGLIDFETANSYHITVRAADQYGLFVDKEFTLAVTDVYERIHADFNGDGRSDILLRDDSSMVAVWNSGVPSGGHVVADPGPAASWHIAGLGDFDGNARADILWQNNDGTVAVWDNGTPSGGHVVAGAGAAAGWQLAGVGDFDGNHRGDILWQNDSGAVAVWDNGTPAGGRMIADSGTAGWHVAATADFDGNGKEDVLWRNDSGALAVWDNGTPAGGHSIADPGL